MTGRTPSRERVDTAQVEQLAGLLRSARDQLGWSRDKLGRATGLSANTIRTIETAKTKEPGFFTVATIAEALGIAPNTIHAVRHDQPEGASIREKSTAQQR